MRVMTKQITLSMTLASALIVAACSSSVGGIGGLVGIGGSGYISTGTVTSFGSVFVNGVEFKVNASTYDVEGNVDATQSDLRIGMVVQVSGSVNADGVTGTATHIKYGDDIEGPVSNLSLFSTVDTHSFDILGNQVVVSSATTAFDGVLFAEIAVGNVLEISGFYDQDGVLQASYVSFKSRSSSVDSVFEIKGVIRNLSGNQFQVKRVNVDASAANPKGFANGLANGIAVEVKGTFSNDSFGNGTLLATEIEAEDELSEEADVDIEGIVSRFDSLADFYVNGQKVDASNAELSPTNLVITWGSKVEIGGKVSNGVLIASDVEAREGRAEVSAVVSTTDIDNNSFTVEVLTGQFVEIQLTTSTRMEDNLLLIELTKDNFITVQGLENSDNSITATQIKRESEEGQETQLQGVVTAQSNNSFTVLGVTFMVNGNTGYDGAGNNAAFRGSSMLGQSVISVTVDNALDDFANEIELDD